MHGTAYQDNSYEPSAETITLDSAPSLTRKITACTTKPPSTDKSLSRYSLLKASASFMGEASESYKSDMPVAGYPSGHEPYSQSVPPLIIITPPTLTKAKKKDIDITKQNAEIISFDSIIDSVDKRTVSNIDYQDKFENYKSNLVNAIRDLKALALADLKNYRLTADNLKTLETAVHTFLATSDAAAFKIAIAPIKPIQQDPLWKKALCMLIGAVLGFFVGLMLGAASGPGAAATALAGGIAGAAIGATLGASAGSLLGLGMFSLFKRQHPTTQIVAEVEKIKSLTA
ncbi:MAG TPA: hypothetical protein VHA13_04655 [Gammaproteobacteria bacterium]|nr:hypothetical protein [Gammaproteobacteria bacterium]